MTTRVAETFYALYPLSYRLIESGGWDSNPRPRPSRDVVPTGIRHKALRPLAAGGRRIKKADRQDGSDSRAFAHPNVSSCFDPCSVCRRRDSHSLFRDSCSPLQHSIRTFKQSRRGVGGVLGTLSSTGRDSNPLAANVLRPGIRDRRSISRRAVRPKMKKRCCTELHGDRSPWRDSNPAPLAFDERSTHVVPSAFVSAIPPSLRAKRTTRIEETRFVALPIELRVHREDAAGLEPATHELKCSSFGIRANDQTPRRVRIRSDRCMAATKQRCTVRDITPATLW